MIMHSFACGKRMPQTWHGVMVPHGNATPKWVMVVSCVDRDRFGSVWNVRDSWTVQNALYQVVNSSHTSFLELFFVNLLKKLLKIANPSFSYLAMTFFRRFCIVYNDYRILPDPLLSFMILGQKRLHYPSYCPFLRNAKCSPTASLIPIWTNIIIILSNMLHIHSSPSVNVMRSDYKIVSKRYPLGIINYFAHLHLHLVLTGLKEL